MVDIIRCIDLSADCVFLGLARGDRSITCTLEGLMHVAKDSPTGQGKTSISYAQMVMLLAMQTKIIIANPHFVGVDRKGRDWRPIGAAIEKQGWVDVAPGRKMLPLVRKPQHIETMLRWLATVEIDRRFALMDEGDFSFQPLYIFIDEWPYVVSVCPDAARYMKLVLQRGRAVDVCVDTNSQGFLVADVDLPGSARENFNTAYHMGGNPRSASTLLDMPVADLNKLLRREDTPPLGKGVALLRNNEACPNAELVRLPYADNEFAYYLLGRADHWRINPLPELETSMAEMEEESEHSAFITGSLREREMSGRSEYLNGMNEPVERDEYSAKFRPEMNIHSAQLHVSPEDRAAIIAGAKAQLKATGKDKVNRTQLRDALGWNNGKWDTIKYVLDEEGY